MKLTALCQLVVSTCISVAKCTILTHEQCHAHVTCKNKSWLHFLMKATHKPSEFKDGCCVPSRRFGRPDDRQNVFGVLALVQTGLP